MLLTFQINDNQDSIEILFDKEGLDFLKNLIDKNWYEPICKADGLYDFDHEHLLSKDWGGDELTPEQFEKIIFSKTEHPTECNLTPHKIINFSGFSYYSFRIFSGTLHATDKVLLYFK